MSFTLTLRTHTSHSGQLRADKASSPVNLYGATKLASDKLFIASNAYAGSRETRFSVVRYGNVMGSRGSIIPLFTGLAQSELPITDERMTRFMISLEQAIDMVWHAFDDMVGGEIYVKKIPSMKIVDIASAVCPGVPHRMIGVRPGEKLHEQMISPEDAPHTYEYADYFKILPAIHSWSSDPKRIRDGKKVADGFTYASDNNAEWLSIDALQRWIETHRAEIGHV